MSMHSTATALHERAISKAFFQFHTTHARAVVFNGQHDLISVGLVEALLQALTRDAVDWPSRFKILGLLTLLSSNSGSFLHSL